MNLTLDSLKALGADPEFARLAAACLTAQTIAEATREKVDGYVQIVFAEFTKQHPFYATVRHRDSVGPVPMITEEKYLYQSEDREGLDEYYALCDQAHQMAGYRMPKGYCPALVAENAQIRAQQSFLEYADSKLGTPFAEAHLDARDKALGHMHGIALKNPLTSRLAQQSLPRTQAEVVNYLERESQPETKAA